MPLKHKLVTSTIAEKVNTINETAKSTLLTEKSKTIFYKGTKHTEGIWK